MTRNKSRAIWHSHNLTFTCFCKTMEEVITPPAKPSHYHWLIVKRTVFFCLFVRIGREGWWLVSLFLLVSLYWIGVHFVLLLCLLRGLVRMTVGWYLFYCLLAHTGRAYIFLFDSFVCLWRLAGRAGGCYLSFCLFVWIYRLCGYYIFIFLFVCGDWQGGLVAGMAGGRRLPATHYRKSADKAVGADKTLRFVYFLNFL